MIKIEIEKEKESKQIIYFKISGHAESADYGEDIICASVSAVGQMTLNGLIEILELDKLKYREAEGIIDCDLKTSGLTEEEYEFAKNNIHVILKMNFDKINNEQLIELAQNYFKN